VLDANVLIAALLRDSTTRKLIAMGGIDLHAPAYLFEETQEHFGELLDRSGISASALAEVFRILRGYITEHPVEVYEGHLERAMEILGDSDPRDAPYVALALAIEADALWTEDRGLRNLSGVRTLRTHELVR